MNNKWFVVLAIVIFGAALFFIGYSLVTGLPHAIENIREEGVRALTHRLLYGGLR